VDGRGVHGGEDHAADHGALQGLLGRHHHLKHANHSKTSGV
jgi:hypothetical protein